MSSGGARKPSPMVRAAVAPTPGLRGGSCSNSRPGDGPVFKKVGRPRSNCRAWYVHFQSRDKNAAEHFEALCRILQPSLHRHDFSRWYEDGPCGHSRPDRGKVAPSSTLPSGNVTNGSIAYLTDKVVSRDYKKCDMESMDVTPFGSGQLAAQWKDNGGRGQMN